MQEPLRGQIEDSVKWKAKKTILQIPFFKYILIIFVCVNPFVHESNSFVFENLSLTLIACLSDEIEELIRKRN